MLGMTLKRSARTRRTASLPRTRRPSASGPRAMRNVQSSAKKVRIRSTSLLLNAALMSFIKAGVGEVSMAETIYRWRESAQVRKAACTGWRVDSLAGAVVDVAPARGGHLGAVRWPG